MVCLGAYSQRRILHLNEVADVHLCAENGARAQPRERTDPCILSNASALEMTVGLDLGAVLDGDAEIEEDVRLDDDVAANLGVVRKPDGLRGDQSGAIAHHREARALLEYALGHSELLARVDAEHVVFATGDDSGTCTTGTCNLDRVGEIELALCVLVANARKDAEQIV